MSTDRELIEQVKRETIREVLGSLLDERQSLEEARLRAHQQAEAEELASIRRSQLTPRQKSDLINRIGYERYMKLKFDDDDRLRDPVTGRFRRL